MPRIVDQGVTRLAWVPGIDGIEDVSGPTVDELALAVDLTPVTVTTYEVRPDASDTTDERSVEDVANVVAPTVQNYTGNLILFRDFDDDTEAFTADDALAVFPYKSLGYFVRRLGLPRDEAWAEGQAVEVYLFMADNAQIQGGTGEGYLKATVPLLQQGSFDVHAVVAAGTP